MTPIRSPVANQSSASAGARDRAPEPLALELHVGLLGTVRGEVVDHRQQGVRDLLGIRVETVRRNREVGLVRARQLIVGAHVVGDAQLVS